MSPPRVASCAAVAFSCILSTCEPSWGAEAPTFGGDVAPILQQHCISCHRPSGPAPSFLTYDEVRPWARSIQRQVEARTMPPWLPTVASPAFVGDRRLAEAEIETLGEWVRSGAARGAVSPPAGSPPVLGWQLGEPDLIVEMTSEFVLPAEGGEMFRNFVLSVPIAERRFVRAAELRSDNPRVVHHAVLTVDQTDSSRSLDEDDPLPGFDGMRAFTRARSPSGHFVSWTPGKSAFVGYDGMAWELPPGADLVLETHLLPTGKAESIRARVGLYFADSRPSQQPVVLHLGSKTLDIPAGESAHRIEESLTLPTDLRLLSIYPHAHYLGREMWVYATLPDGRELTLIHIARWDFNWQDQYRFLEPIDLERGTRIRMVYTYDNSLQNPSNPHSPPRRVVYGPSSDDEMGDVWIQGVTNSVPDLLTVLRFLEERDHQDLIAGYRKRLSDSPEDGEALFGLGSELVAVGDLEGGIENLEKAAKLDIEPDGVHLNLGNAYTAAGRAEEAVRQFDLAIASHPERAEGHFNLANTLAAAGRDEESLLAYERALELRPGFASALLNRGNALARVGRSDEALEHYRRALKARPGYPPAVFNLALDARRRGQPSEALDYIAEGLEAEPWSSRLLVAHGDALFDLGFVNRALQSYRLAIEVDPRSPGAYVGLGLGLVRQGDLENARRALEKALKIEPGNVDAALALEELLRSAD